MTSYGFPRPAGMGRSTVVADVDVESWSLAGWVWNNDERKWEGPPGAPGDKRGLPVVGAHNYWAHPSAEILLMAYDLKDGHGRRRWRHGQPFPEDLRQHILSGRTLEAWNAGFERWAWELVGVVRYGWPAVLPDQWTCAMARARAAAYPGSLDLAGAVMRLDTRKDADGTRLMKRFSMPVRPTQSDPRTRARLLWTQDDVHRALAEMGVVGKVPSAVAKRLTQDIEDTRKYADYNETDIATEAEASALCPDLVGLDLRWWRAHEAINRRGVQMDMDAIESAIAVIEQTLAKYNTELFALTGIDAASKVAQLLGWLHGQGVHLDSLDEDAVEGALEGTLPPTARRVLEIRAAAGSASVKKAFAMRCRASPDGRLRDLFIFAGARTGRSTGEGPQPLNSPKAGPDMAACSCGHHHRADAPVCPWCQAPVVSAKVVEWNPDAAEDAIAVLKQRSAPLMEHVFGDALPTLAGCLRGFYIAAPGHDLISSDFNSIEAVGLAMISGEQWRIDVFRTHGKIYETSASTMYRVPFDEIIGHEAATGQHHPLRQKGKVAELAFGYGGWLGSARAFGMPGTEDEIKADILAWRRASPSIEWLWGGQTLGKAAGVMLNADRPIGADRWDRSPYYFGVEGAFVQAVLQSGREFPVVRLDGSETGVVFVMHGDALYCRLQSGRYLTYHRPRLQPSDRGGLEFSFEGYNSNPKNGPIGWIRMRSWGSRVVENINQAECADIMRYSACELDDNGYPVVLHVYDEIVSEVPEGRGSTEEFEKIMVTTERWAAEWPVRAPRTWRAKRYAKR